MGIYDRLSLVNKILDDINLSVERKGISGTGRDFIQLAVKEYLESLPNEYWTLFLYLKLKKFLQL